MLTVYYVNAGTEGTDGRAACSYGCPNGAAEGGQQQDGKPQHHTGEGACIQRGGDCRAPGPKLCECLVIYSMQVVMIMAQQQSLPALCVSLMLIMQLTPHHACIERLQVPHDIW